MNQHKDTKPMKTKLLLLILALLPSALAAQSVRVTGEVRHAITGFGIKGVKVTLADTLGNPIDTTRTEPALRTVWYEDLELFEYDEKGGATFSLSAPHEGAFLLVFEKDGLETLTRAVDVSFGKRTHSYNAGTVSMFDEVQDHGVAVVQGTRIKMFYRGDTLVYNASAFATPEGSVLEDLIAMLPGAELRDGNIYVNGEKMEELLLDGKDFFQGDPQLALKSLPAYTVDKLKVYRKDGAQSRLMGRDMGDRHMVMDVRLKREYHEQWFGKAVGGLGNKHHYDGNAMLMHFDDRQSLMLYGRNNNCNEDISLSQYGDGGYFWNTGRRKTGRYGTAYSFEPSDALRLSLKADYGHSGYATDESTRTEYLLESGHTFSQQRRTAYSSKDEFNTSASLEMKHKRTSFRADYRFTLDKTADTATELLANYADDPAASPLEDAWLSWQGITSRQRTGSESHTQNVRHRADVRADISFAPDVLTLKAKLDYTNRRSTARQDYLLEYPATSRRNRTLAPAPEHKLLGELHGEFILKYADFEGRDGQIKPFYTFGITRSASRHPFFTHEATQDTSNTAATADFGWTTPVPDEAFIPDEANTYNNRYTNLQQDFGLILSHKARLPNRTWTTINATLQFSDRHATLEQQRPSETLRPRRNALFFTPSINWAWHYIPDDKDGNKGNFRLVYAISRDIPDLLLLTDRRDDRNPLFVSLGNPALRNSLTHKIRFHAVAKRGKFTYFSNNSWNIYRNQTATSRRYDRETGVLTTQPVNISGGQWTLRSDHHFSLDMGNAHLSISPALIHQRRADLMQTEADNPNGRHTTHQTELSLTAYLVYDNSKLGSLSMYLRAFDNRTSSSRPDYSGLHTQQISSSLNLSLKLPLGLSAHSYVTLQKPFGWSGKDMNRLRTYCDAQLSRTLAKRLRASIELNDLFNQGPRRTLTLTDYARTEQTAATPGRHFLLSLTWDFHVQPKNREANKGL